jgi:hypothetical protein
VAFSEIELKRIEGIVAPFCARRRRRRFAMNCVMEYRIKDRDELIALLSVLPDRLDSKIGA